jgi:tetratricopeptide (TPR) repeat protein
MVLAVTCEAAMADVLAECRQLGPEVNMGACTEVITSPSFGPDDKAFAYRRRGEARTNAGENRAAVADFTESIRLKKDDMSAFAGRGRANFADGNLAGSIADYSEAIRLSKATHLSPDLADLYVQRGHVYVVSKQLDAAISDLTEAIRLNPSSVDALNTRGVAYVKKGDFDRAIDDYTAAIALLPFPVVYANRGFAYEAENRQDLAIADFQYALMHDPAQVGVRDALKRLGVPPDAITSQTNQLISEGAALAEKSCSSCHAVGLSGDSPNKKAVEFRNFYKQQPLFVLRQPITRAIRGMHDQMPDEHVKLMKVTLSDNQIDMIVAYINSLSTANRLGTPQ